MTRLKARSGGPRRWPDVMIGVLVLALLGGFGALLLEQRPRPVAQAPAEPPATVVIPASPGTVSELPTPQQSAPQTQPQPPQTQPEQPSEVQTPAAQAPVTQTPEAQAPADQGEPTATPQNGEAGTAPAQSTSTQSTPAQTAPAQTAPAQTTPAQTTPAQPAPPRAAGSSATQPRTADDGTAAATEIPPVPAAPPVGPLTTLPLPDNAQPVQPSVPVTAPPSEAPTVTATPRAAGAVATSDQRTPLRSDYRISLGSFGTEGTVRTQTAGVSGLGYTVYPIDIGNEYVAQVGPFADEASARQALADIQRAYPSALLYRPRERAAQTEADRVTAPAATDDAPTQAAPEPSAEASPAQETATPAAQAPAPSGPRYLQVGAFDREDSAQRLVGMLRDAGFAPTVSAPPEGKVTVLVGPYSGDALLRAEGRLDSAGMDHFRVR